MSSVFIALFVLVALLVPLVLYGLIERETTSTRIMDRADAEREAQRRGGVRNSQREGASDPTRDDDEGDDDHWGYSRLDDERR